MFAKLSSINELMHLDQKLSENFTCCIFIYYFLFFYHSVYMYMSHLMKTTIKTRWGCAGRSNWKLFARRIAVFRIGYRRRKFATTYRGVSTALLSCYSNLRINQNRRYPGTAYKLECKVFERKFLSVPPPFWWFHIDRRWNIAARRNWLFVSSTTLARAVPAIE